MACRSRLSEYCNELQSLVVRRFSPDILELISRDRHAKLTSLGALNYFETTKEYLKSQPIELDWDGEPIFFPMAAFSIKISIEVATIGNDYTLARRLKMEEAALKK